MITGNKCGVSVAEWQRGKNAYVYVSSRLIILLRSFCNKDGKPRSVTFAGRRFPGIIDAIASKGGAFDTSIREPRTLS